MSETPYEEGDRNARKLWAEGAGQGKHRRADDKGREMTAGQRSEPTGGWEGECDASKADTPTGRPGLVEGSTDRSVDRMVERLSEGHQVTERQPGG